MSMNTYKLNGITTPTNNDDAVNKSYVDTEVSGVSTNVIAVQARTQNQTADVLGTTFDKNSSFVLRVDDGNFDYFTVRNNERFSVSRFSVSNASVQINNPLFMQNQRIQLLGTPTRDT